MSLHLAQKGGTQLTAPQENSAVFTAMQYADPQRNAFNLSCQTHGTLEYGKIYPVYSRMLFSGDSLKVKASHFVRFASVLSPILNKTYITYAAFYVPFRLVWKYWPTYISGGYNNDGVYTDSNGNYLDKNDEYTTTPFKPQIPRVSLKLSEVVNNKTKPVFNFQDGSLADWLGYPTFPNDTYLTNNILMQHYQGNAIANPMALPFMCYQKVINDYFTNPNIKDSSRVYALPPTSVSGLLDKKYRSLTELATVNYGMDYFTSCLPYLQRGDTFTLERTDSTITFDETPSGGGSPLLARVKLENVTSSNKNLGVKNPNSLDWQDLVTLGSDSKYSGVLLDNSRNLSVSLHSTISELRYLNAIQRFQEKSLRAGTRYVDFLKCFFGVKSSDKSLQRSEYLGAKVTEISKEDINQTSATNTADDTTPLGTVASKMLGVANTQSFNCYAEENGMFFVFAFVTPETIYKNRFKTEYLYEDKEDFLFPEFTHLSPQAVKLAELWCPRNTSGDTSADLSRTFGYQDRYNELRCDMNSVHGDFKNNLSFFLQMRDFGSAPYLNTSFLSAKDIDTSIFASDVVKDKDGNNHKVSHIWASFDFDVKAVRCLPKLSTPSLI